MSGPEKRLQTDFAGIAVRAGRAWDVGSRRPKVKEFIDSVEA